MCNLKLGSLFDGSGGFPLAGALLGIEPVWASEIEPFPIRVTHARFPNMKHLGSIIDINGADIEPVDVITFGSPCQDVSVAGKREGLHDGKQSSLFFQAIRLIKEMRQATNGKYPRFLIFENVPGLFSSHKGEDFRCVIESICSIKDSTVSIPKPQKWQHAGCVRGDGYSMAWRLYDAQHFGVAQRRKRIFLVADLGSECAEKILFESQVLPRYSKQGYTAWQSITAYSRRSIEGSGELCVGSFMGGNGPKAYSIGYDENVSPSFSPSLKSSPSGQNTVPDVVYSVSGFAQYTDQLPTLRASGGDAGVRRACSFKAYSIGNGQLNQISMSEVCNTLDCMHDKQAVLYEIIEFNS